jgi:hypothetical protein
LELCLLLCILLTGGAFESDEVVPLVSPNGKADVVILEGSAGAMTSFLHEICLVPHGKACGDEDKVASLYSAARSEHAAGVNIHWAGTKRLTVEYSNAKLMPMHRPLATLEGKALSISQQSGITDANAPQGGMYYNMHRGSR